LQRDCGVEPRRLTAFHQDNPLAAAHELLRKKEINPVIKLGDPVRDKITGYKGIVVARTEWLNGCVRLVVQARKLHEGKPVEPQTFDEPQLELEEAEAETGPKVRPGGGDCGYVATRR
jgi:hypothetical protein